MNDLRKDKNNPNGPELTAHHSRIAVTMTKIFKFYNSIVK